MDKNSYNKKSKEITLQVESAKHEHKVDSVEIWEKASFSKDWFEDAKKEIRSQDAGARRREILFSVCCAEAYLIEWVRDQILNDDPKKLSKYFPSGQKKGIIDKWKEIPKMLYKDGLIQACPDNSNFIFQHFKKLIYFRNNLVHAKSSRPASAGQSSDENPFPTLSELQGMQPGWAIEVLITLLENLHKTTNTLKPEWMTYS